MHFNFLEKSVNSQLLWSALQVPVLQQTHRFGESVHVRVLYHHETQIKYHSALVFLR